MRHVAKHARRRRRGQSDSQPEAVGGWADEGLWQTGQESAPESSESSIDWFGPSQPGEDDGYVPRMEVPLASMLMLGANSWQRIDGMGMARKALEAAANGDLRHDLSDDERFLLANGRAFCLVVHADLAHEGQRDDPFVVADASRHLDLARATAPDNPQWQTTLALVLFRQGRHADALDVARGAVQAFGSLPDRERSGRTQGAALLALATWALVAAASGDLATSRAVAAAARALKAPVDIEEASFASLMAELSEWDRPDP